MEHSADATRRSGAMRSWPAGSPQSPGGPWIRYRASATHEAAIPDDLVARLQRLSDDLALPLSSVLLAAHAKVLSALSGEQDVATGYVAEEGAEPLLCRLSTEFDSWRSMLLDVHQRRV